MKNSRTICLHSNVIDITEILQVKPLKYFIFVNKASEPH